MLDQVIVERIGWTLVHSVWQGAIGTAGLGVVLFLMKRASAQARYVASCAALGAIVTAAVLTLGIQRPTLGGSERVAFGAASVKLVENNRSAEAEPTGMIASAMVASHVALTPKERVARGLPWAVAGWGVGVLVISIWQIGGWVRVQSWRRRGKGNVPAEWEKMVARLVGRMGIRGAVGLVESVVLRTPAVVGVFRPVILAPICAMSGLSGAQVEAILAHELAHVRRHDYLVNLIQTAIETLLFYHPGVWWISGRIREERENCCDDVAAGVCGDRAGYAEALASMEEMRGEKHWLTSSQWHRGNAVGAGGGSLRCRVARILGMPVGRGRRSWSMVAGLAAMVCVVLAFGTMQLRAQKMADAGAKAQATTRAETGNLATGKKEFLKIVVGRAGIKLENSDSSWDEVEKIIAKIPDLRRESTVLELAAESGDLPYGRFMDAYGNAQGLVDKYRLGYVSQVGIDGAAVRGNAGVKEGVPVEVIAGIRGAFGYVPDPNSKDPVDRLMATTRAQAGEYYMMGTSREGVYSLTGREISVKQAMISGGMFPKDGKQRYVTVMRREGDTGESYPIVNAAIDSGLENEELKLILRPDDVVMFATEKQSAATQPAPRLEQEEKQAAEGPWAGEYYMGGDIRRVGVYSLTGRKVNLKEALISAGLWKDDGRPRYVTIIRREGKDKERVPLQGEAVDLSLQAAALRMILRPNDIVQVSTKQPAAPVSGKNETDVEELELQRVQLRVRLALMKKNGKEWNDPDVVRDEKAIEELTRRIDAIGPAATRPAESAANQDEEARKKMELLKADLEAVNQRIVQIEAEGKTGADKEKRMELLAERARVLEAQLNDLNGIARPAARTGKGIVTSQPATEAGRLEEIAKLEKQKALYDREVKRSMDDGVEKNRPRIIGLMQREEVLDDKIKGLKAAATQTADGKPIRAIVVGDLVSVSVADLEGQGVETVKVLRVPVQGSVFVPVVGQVKIAGLTEAGAERAVVKAYRDANVMMNAQVKVKVMERADGAGDGQL